VKWEYDWEWADAESEFQRALELSPNDATMHQCYSEYLMAMGREAEALAEIRRAQELDPLSLIINSIGGFDYYFAHQYDQAIEQCKQTLDMDPNFYLAHLYLAASFEEKGMLAEAIAEAEKVKTIIGRAPPSLMMLGRVYASASKRNESLRTVTEMKKMAAQIYVDPFYVAMVYASLGDSDQLFEWLEKSLQDRSYWLSSIRVNPMLDHYRSDPRYDSLLRRVGLTP
jgi:tetratricopeptide (TPR) repeat protein